MNPRLVLKMKERLCNIVKMIQFFPLTSPCSCPRYQLLLLCQSTLAGAAATGKPLILPPPACIDSTMRRRKQWQWLPNLPPHWYLQHLCLENRWMAVASAPALPACCRVHFLSDELSPPPPPPRFLERFALFCKLGQYLEVTKGNLKFTVMCGVNCIVQSMQIVFWCEYLWSWLQTCWNPLWRRKMADEFWEVYETKHHV